MGYFKVYVTKKQVFVQLHTAGWSGNEDLYCALEKVKWLGLFWQKSVRGGHYYYTFPRFVWDAPMFKQKEQKKNGN